MGKPIWRNTEEAAKFVYGSAAWGAAAGIFADIPEKIGTATVSLAKKTLGSLEKIFGRKPTPKDIEKIRIKPIAGSAKKTAKFQPPEQTAELEDISGRIIAQAQAWLEKHPIDLPDTDGKDAPPEQSSSSFPAARTTKLITEKTAELSRSEQEAMGLPQPVSAEEMQENLSREELFEGKPELAEKDELTDKERKENAAVQRAHILQATGLGSGNRASYREFNQALKDFVKAGDEAQLRVVSSFLKEHGEDLIGEEGAPVLMWADRRHLEKLIDKRLGTTGQAAEEPSRPDTHAPPTPVVPAHVPPQPDAENVSQEPSAPHLPPMSDVHEESERLRKIAEEETKPLHALPDALLSQWDAPVPAQQAAGDEDLTLEKLLAEPLAKLGSRPIDTVRSQMGADAKRLRESGDARGLRNQGARAMLRGLLINRIDPETLRRLRGGIWTTENISDPIMKKIAEEVEGIHRLSNEDIAHKLMKELKPKVAPKIDLEEDRLYRKVFADKVLRKDVSGGMNVYKDESEGFVYRGPDLAALRTVDDIVSRARLNVSLTSAAIDRLDVLAKDFGFMYRVGMPTSGTSPSENRDSVTIYFPDGSSDRVISVLRDFAEDEAFKRGRPDDLYGKRVTEHFYLGEDFAEKLPKDEALKFLATLQRMHRQLYEIVSGYVGDTGEITEKQFHVVKEFLAPFGFPIRYSKEQGVLFNVPSRNKRHSVA
ncbi:hypothetical protein HYV71_03255 [Candidatus Uhrbacteria bacterium]|nr:hypothetical protein [Candidatus Uhrbacteria bacterium]